MSSSGQPPRLHRIFLFFDPEAAAVVSILLGLFQVLLSVPLYYMQSQIQISRPPALFLVPLCLGCLIVAAGSMGVASERNPSRHLLKGCAYTTIASQLGALVALCVYGFSFHSIQQLESCLQPTDSPHGQDSTTSPFWYPRECPSEYLESFIWCVTLMLVLYDLSALLLQSLLSFSAVKGLKAN